MNIILPFIQNTIAELEHIKNPKEISLSFSFQDKASMSEANFIELLERLEEEMHIDLLDHTMKFKDVGQLVSYISNYR